MQDANVISEAKKFRLQRLRKKLNELGADALIVFNSEDENRSSLHYISGFSGPVGVAVISTYDARLIVDSRYLDQAVEQSYLPVAVIDGTGRDPWSLIGQTVGDFGIKTLAFEEDRLDVASYGRFAEIGTPVLGLSGLVLRLRAEKDLEEIASIRHAARIAASALDAIVPTLHIGLTEKQIASRLFSALLERGTAQLVSGICAVAGGERGANPYGVFTDRVVGRGDMVTIGAGAVVDGYSADMTRTLAFGYPSPRMVDLYYAALEANKMAISIASPTASGSEIDYTVRDFLTKRGYGKNIRHPVGHGVGLDLRELPNISPSNGEKLQVGATIKIGVGLYEDCLGGVRIEDSVLITENGAEVLTAESQKELKFLL
ncbi:MAG: Xaa-Pro peptidase family protein [Synergistaceae bacterium]|jgi:Xaa-Pro aminopeptidase|nr:Xaa-Pro peptidase family protein [Synergistaceae bacterium]